MILFHNEILKISVDEYVKFIFSTIFSTSPQVISKVNRLFLLYKESSRKGNNANLNFRLGEVPLWKLWSILHVSKDHFQLLSLSNQNICSQEQLLLCLFLKFATKWTENNMYIVRKLRVLRHVCSKTSK